MSKDVIPMQVSPVASKSAFSTSGTIINPSRGCLTHYMIKALMCVEQRMKADIKLSENVLWRMLKCLLIFELHEKLEKSKQYLLGL